jgi:hypothetical protein
LSPGHVPQDGRALCQGCPWASALECQECLWFKVSGMYPVWTLYEKDP